MGKLNNKVVVITGGNSGIGLGIAEAFKKEGAVGAIVGRNRETLDRSVAQLGDNFIAIKADVTSLDDLERVFRESGEKFGKIDVLVNNAASFYAGYFEELSMEEIELQVSTSLFGPMKVTRAVLPAMRQARKGHIITISSTAGLVGYTFCSAYAASKFGVDGWMESLQTEVEQFGITTTIVNPGFFRTELLTEESTKYASHAIEDYAEGRRQQMTFWKGANGQQQGNPAKLAEALLKIVNEEKPPRRFLAGEDAVATADQVSATLKKEADAYRELSSSLAYE